MTLRFARICVTCICILFTSTASGGEVDRELQKTLQAAIPGWAKTEAALDDIEIGWTGSSDRVDPTYPNDVSKCRIYWDAPRNCQMQETIREARSLRNISSSNPKYRFMIAWVGKDVVKPEVMSVAVNEEGKLGALENANLRNSRLLIRSTTSVAGIPLRTILSEEEGYKISLLEKNPATGGASLEVIYTGVRRPGHNPDATLYAELDPSKDWTVVRTRTSFLNGDEREKIVESAKYEGFGWIPKRIETIDRNAAGTASETNVYEYGAPKLCTLPDAEFRLAHYGLPELTLETLEPNPWPRWLLVAGGCVAMAVGGWLLFGKRKRAA